MNPNINPDGENLSSSEKEFEKVLRPAEFDDFTGQFEVVENLKIFVQAAKQRGEALDHVLQKLFHAIGESDEAVVPVTAVPEAMDHPYRQLAYGARESAVHLRRSLAPMVIRAGDERQPAVVDRLARNDGHLVDPAGIARVGILGSLTNENGAGE